MYPPLTIAIDGPAAAGKGTLAKRVAGHYRLPYLDTGLLYRAVGRQIALAGADPDDPEAAGQFARALDLAHLDDPTLRGHEAGEIASRVAVHGPVREALVAFQRGFAARPEGAVLDGRDIGTVICPEAEVKLCVTASAEVRAKRRFLELADSGTTYEAVLEDVRARDERDMTRAEAPLKPADDALTIDTSALSIEEAVAQAIAVIGARQQG